MRLNDDAVEVVAKSIREFGFRQPIVVDEAGVVFGHTRLKASKSLGLSDVPVHVACGLSSEQVKALHIADNKTAQIAEWNLELQPIERAELQGMDFDLGLLGCSQGELAHRGKFWQSESPLQDRVPHQPMSPLSHQQLSHAPTQGLRGDRRGGGLRGDPFLTIAAEDDPFQGQAIPLESSQHSDRSMASRLQLPQARPLGQHFGESHLIGQATQDLARERVIDPAFQTQRRLPHSRIHQRRSQHRADPPRQAQPPQTRLREDNRVVLPVVDLPQPRLDVPPDFLESQVRSAVQ